MNKSFNSKHLDELQPGLHPDVVYGDTLHGWYVNRRKRPRAKKSQLNANPHPYRDRESMSYLDTAGIGNPRMYEISKSYKPLEVEEKTSTGWRPYSRLQTDMKTPPCHSQYFERDYSRSYSRPYSRPYNIDDKHVPYVYSTSYLGDKDKTRYGNIGSYQKVTERPKRDYKKRYNTLRVKGYERDVMRIKN